VAALPLEAAFSQVFSSLPFALVGIADSDCTLCLHVDTACLACAGGRGVTAGVVAVVPLLVVAGLVVAGLVVAGLVAAAVGVLWMVVVDVELPLLPQPARKAPPASAARSHVDSFKIIDPSIIES